MTRKGAWPGAVRRRRGWICGVEYIELPPDADCVGLLNMDKVKIDPALALRVPAQSGLAAPGVAVRPGGRPRPRRLRQCPGYRGACKRSRNWWPAPVRAESAEPESLQRALDRVYADLPTGAARRGGGSPKSRSVDLRTVTRARPDDAVVLGDEMLHAAILRQASDIHIDPEQDGLQIRFRVDGVLERYRRLPVACKAASSAASRCCAAWTSPRSGPRRTAASSIAIGRTGQTIDIRVATLPTKYGERMTLRSAGPANRNADAGTAGHARRRSELLSPLSRPAARHDPADRAHRQRQDDDALRRHSPADGARKT